MYKERGDIIFTGFGSNNWPRMEEFRSGRKMSGW